MTELASGLSLDTLADQAAAVLFLAGSLEVAELARALEVTVSRAEDVYGVLRDNPPRGLALVRDGSRVELVTAPGVAPAISRYLASPTLTRLSRAALDTLAIVAYRQPVTRGDIDAIRGVSSDAAVGTLLSRGLIAEVGRRETLGRPALFGTTAELLRYLGIPDLNALVPLEQVQPHEGLLSEQTLWR